MKSPTDYYMDNKFDTLPWMQRYDIFEKHGGKWDKLLLFVMSDEIFLSLIH